MNKKALMFCLTLAPLCAMGQQMELKHERLSNPDNEPVPVHPIPHQRQLDWQRTEFYGFFHYGMNTYTNMEWGNGDEKESLFAPTSAPDPAQWLRLVRKAGMHGGIAVVKHHDGFCLWPTETTTHNVTKGGNKFGRETNIPRDFGNAARELNMKYGFYISPWDRNSAYYGTDKYVSDVFLRQCAELAQYGSDQFEMWFDGANGGSGYYGGKGGTVTVDEATYYDVPNLRDSVHQVCPNCVMWGVGGEARWIGNEAGWAGETNWSPWNRSGSNGDRMYGNIDGEFWEPGESDAKATTSGWFYHDGESCLSSERLFQMYLETVGRNATLILNVPPAKTGRLTDNDSIMLCGMGKMLKERLGVDIAEGQDDVTAATDLAQTATISFSNERQAGANRSYGADQLIDDNDTTFWGTDDNIKTGTVTMTWNTGQTMRYVVLMEPVKYGQRVKDFSIELSTDGKTWKEYATSITTTIGYKRIIPLNGNTSNSYANPKTNIKALRVSIKDSKACPLLAKIAVY